MGFLKRLLGGGGNTADRSADPGDGHDDSIADGRSDKAALDADERQHEIELLREESARLDELTQRQLRYASYAWEPPAQGGERRADDGDSTG
jgi:hypothetical protein